LTKAFREAGFLLLSAVGLYFLIALLTFDMGDPGWTHTGNSASLSNGAGRIGAWLADVSLSMFGVTAYAVPVALAALGYALFHAPRGKQPLPPSLVAVRGFGALAAVLATAGLVHLLLPDLPVTLPESGGGSGGILGTEIVACSAGYFGTLGTAVLLTASVLAGMVVATGGSWVSCIDRLGAAALTIVNGFLSVFRRLSIPAGGTEEPESAEPLAPVRAADAPKKAFKSSPGGTGGRTAPPGKPHSSSEGTTATRTQDQAQRQGRAIAAVAPHSASSLPSLDLLNPMAPKVRGYSDAALESMSRQLESILSDFGVDAEVVEVHPGPVITRFELQPAAGVKVSRISGLAKDLARALSVTSVRVVEVIPGKSVVGLEIPNQERELVLLHSVVASDVYRQNPSPLTLVLGKDIGGEPVVANLAKMPHLLVAGTTGSGKSVAINVMVLSVLFKARPDEVRMIMIDPKMLELSIYEGIPHLLTPVVTDMKEAANALRWCVAEMERRYRLMSRVGVRNLAGFNQKLADAAASGTPLRDPLWTPDALSDEDEAPLLEPLPYIVIVIDELADMMMIVGKKVEELIARLAQKARAAGLHLILATQRPSVDVITGLIKANIPTRIAFQVSSRIDSRTIIDQGGAEALLGNGDMLYLPPGTGFPLRAHGAFVSDQEVHDVVDFLKRTGQPAYLDEITRFSEEGGDFSGFRSAGDGEDLDALYDEAVRFVTESRKASISSVQRRFKVGYNRAARMIEDMEKAGIVGPAETNGSREVLAPPPPEI
jgi:S-DNA-T family DNA segregation ATPase FtsK/SpoIIIE